MKSENTEETSLLTSPETWLYKSDSSNRNRFYLGQKGKKILCCIGVNPSTAAPGKLDGTTRSVKRISEANGYDGWLMLNLYPQRSTNPDKLHQNLQLSLHRENLTQLENCFQTIHKVDLWAAWGVLFEKRPWLVRCTADIVSSADKFNGNWICAGTTMTGHPRHPLYLAKKSLLKPFDVNEYMRAMKYLP